MEVKASKDYSLKKDSSSYSRSDTSLYMIQRKDMLQKVCVVSNVNTRLWEEVIFPKVSSRVEQYPKRRPQTTTIRTSREHFKNAGACPLPPLKWNLAVKKLHERTFSKGWNYKPSRSEWAEFRIATTSVLGVRRLFEKTALGTDCLHCLQIHVNI